MRPRSVERGKGCRDALNVALNAQSSIWPQVNACRKQSKMMCYRSCMHNVTENKWKVIKKTNFLTKSPRLERLYCVG